MCLKRSKAAEYGQIKKRIIHIRFFVGETKAYWSFMGAYAILLVKDCGW